MSVENEVRTNNQGEPIHKFTKRTILWVVAVDVLGIWLFFDKEAYAIASLFYLWSVAYPFFAVWTWWHKRPLARNLAFFWLGTLPISIIFFLVMKDNSSCHMIQNVCTQ